MTILVNVVGVRRMVNIPTKSTVIILTLIEVTTVHRIWLLSVPSVIYHCTTSTQNPNSAAITYINSLPKKKHLVNLERTYSMSLLRRLSRNILKDNLNSFSGKSYQFNQTMSQRFSLNKTDLVSWGKNALIFLAPALLVLLASIQGVVPHDSTKGVVILYLVNVLADLLRKFVSQS